MTNKDKAAVSTLMRRLAAYIARAGERALPARIAEHAKQHVLDSLCAMQVKEACERIPAPVLTIWGGPEPAPTPEEYEKLGLRIVLYPVIGATAGMQAAWHLFNDLRQRGKPALDDWAAGVRASPYGAIQLKTVVNSAKVREIEDAFLPDSVKRDYDNTWGHATPLGEKNL